MAEMCVAIGSLRSLYCLKIKKTQKQKLRVDLLVKKKKSFF